MNRAVTPTMAVAAVVILIAVLFGVWYVTVGRKTVFIGPPPPVPNLLKGAPPPPTGGQQPAANPPGASQPPPAAPGR